MPYEMLLDQSCEKCTSLPGQAGVYSVESFSDIPVSVLSRLNLTGEKSCFNDNETESCQSSQSGMTSGHSMENHGEEKLMSCAVDSRAKTLVQPAREPGSKENEADCGNRCYGWFAKYDLNTFSWKTPHYSLFEGWEQFSGTWPRSGFIQDGLCLEQNTSVDTVRGNDSGLLPRPQKVDGQKWYVVSKESALKRVKEGRQLMLIHVTGLTEYMHLNKWWANPPFWEAMMDWPIGWTDLKPLAMDKFARWWSLHGKRLEDLPHYD